MRGGEEQWLWWLDAFPGDSVVLQNLRTMGLGHVLKSPRLFPNSADTLLSGSDSVGGGWSPESCFLNNFLAQLVQWFSEPQLRGTALDQNSWVLTYGLGEWNQP